MNVLCLQANADAYNAHSEFGAFRPTQIKSAGLTPHECTTIRSEQTLASTSIEHL
jgi:hypothetical protein